MSVDAARRAALEAAYVKTAYTVETARGVVVLRVGERHAELDELLAHHHSATWAYVTAYNPRSEVLPQTQNTARHQNLLARLEARGYEFLHGAGISETDADWQPERSVLIFNITLADALNLAREFDQNAILFGRAGEVAQLVWAVE